ncbi:MAG: ABC transporter ATP-binding protein [Lewinella sp.]
MTIEKLTFGYENTLVFEDLTIELTRGKIYGLVGPNGIGKTTLISLLSGIQRNYRGSIKGIERPGLLLQNTSFYDNLTGQENLRLVCNDKQIHHDRAEEVLRLVAIRPALAKQKFKTYSQGYRQRLGIARSLLTDSDLVLLDEPFTAVDVETIGIIKKAIVRYVAKTGKTIILSSHQLREIEDILDLILLVKDRKLISLQSDEWVSGNKGAHQIFVTFPASHNTVEALRACRQIKEMQAVQEIIRIQLEDGCTISDLLAYMEERQLAWKRIDRKMPLEFLYATHSA